MKKTLLCGVAIAMLATVPANAQTVAHAKPTGQMTQCGDDAANTYQVVKGAPTLWHEPYYPEVGYWEYRADYPVAECDNAVRNVALKCVDQTGATASTQKCFDSNAVNAFQNANPNLTIQTYDQEGNEAFFAVEQTNLGSCPAGAYTWKIDPPATADVCGTRDVPVRVSCIKVSTGEETWDESKCDAIPRPSSTKSVTSKEGCGYDFTATAWSEVPPSCGQVTQTRTVACAGPDGVVVDEQKCASYLTLDPKRYAGNQGVPVSEYWSKGMIHWDIGSPSYYGNNILIYRMPTLCDVGDTDAMQAECEVRYNMAGGYQQTYIRPKATKVVSDARACTADPAATYDEYHWNTPTYVTDNPSTCGSNTKTGRVFCIKNADSAEVDGTLCDPSKKPQATITFDDTSACEPVAPPTDEPTTSPPTPPPSPEIVPVPDAGPPTEIELGSCRYTSSGGGRYACGQTFREGSNPAPFPHELCTGSIIAGTETDFSTEYQTSNVGPNWQIKATLKNVPGAHCVVHYRAYGYSNDRQEGWESVYFSGKPSGVAGGLFISKKP